MKKLKISIVSIGILACKLFLMSTVAAICFGIAGTAVAATLIGHWTFDSDLTDSVGSNNGTSISNAAAGASGAIIGSGAATFDGAGDAIKIDKSVISDGTFSITFWEKNASGNQGYLAAAGTGSGSEDFFWRRFNSISGKPVYAGAISALSLGETDTSQTNYPRNVWHHIALTQNAEGEVARYVDGKLMPTWKNENDHTTIANPRTGSSFTGLNGDLYIGNRKDLNRPYSGLIDDLRIYHTALSPTQIEVLATPPPPSAPKGTIIIIN